jgi:lysozyme family protein
VLGFVLHVEGGYVADKDDLGGATNHGITQTRFNSYLNQHKLTPRSVHFITLDEVRYIYQTGYWCPSFAYLMDYPLAVALMDTSVNFNPQTFKKFVSQALGLKPPSPVNVLRMFLGKDPSWFVTNEMLAALKVCDQKTVAMKLVGIRMDYRHFRVAQNPTQHKFLAGWLNRDQALAGEIVHPTYYKGSPQ